ncbi:hypothetical protein HW115_07380 [Verrucomicrobiaceae bacterium N1E253]|uniref:Outer membrane protein n=1 Tax=Oceaniferula marina TaxID=2748318 RepID=A0A851GCG9_9BACT|nr:TorF family putative porin [Oceaniferula marina]NWK55428.1 hypothetical protein [Oceaniferula marina]
MNKSIQSIILGSSLLVAAPAFAGVATEMPPAPAAESPFEFEIHTGYHSIYEFRGVDFGDDLWEAGIDGSYAISDTLSLSGGLWYADNVDFDELDLYLGLTKSFEHFDLSVGYTYYLFPGDSDADTQEFYVGASTEVAWGIGLGLTYFYDFDLIEGGYLELEATKSFSLTDCLGLDFAVGAAWSFDYNGDVDGGDLDGFNHWYASVALPWEIREGVTLAPYAKFVGAGSDLNNEYDADASEDLFLGGAVLTVTF